ncbi:MAG: TonB-dependent receptor [Ferruginibacter sp.]|nr:TonB-dependent receptor [Ferruginibacter sp.]
MKSFLFSCFSILLVISVNAQEPINTIENDSSKIILLQNVDVKATIKTPTQQLINFCKYNNIATVEEILARLPEVSMIHRGAYGIEPTIRYFNAGQINMQIDGMKIHGACTDKMDPATIYIEPINLENVQVQNANQGFLNGSSIGGTINMKLADANYLYNNKITGAINSGYQTSAKSFYESLRLNYALQNWAIAASGTYRKNHNYKSGSGKEVLFSQYEKTNFSITTSYKINQKSKIKLDILADDGWNIGYAALPMDVGKATAKIISLSLLSNNNLKRIYNWQAKIYTNKVIHFMDDTKRPNIPIHMDMPGVSKTSGIFIEGNGKINKKQKITFRVDAASTFLQASMTMYQTGQPPMYMLTWPDNKKNQIGASLSWALQVDSTLKVSIASRADFVKANLVTNDAKNHVSIFGDTTIQKDFLKNASVSISKKIFNKLQLNTALSYSERTPTATEMYGFYLFNASDGYDYIGKTNLLSEKSLQFDLSTLYKWKQNKIQINYYFSKVNNFIVGKINSLFSSMTIGANGVKNFSNISFAKIWGLEATSFVNLSPKFITVSTFRYTNAKDNNNMHLPFVSPLKNTTTLRYQPNHFFAQLETEIAASQNTISKNYGEDATASYFLLHSRIGYNTKLYKNNIELQAGVENIFNKNYHDHLDWGNIPRMGRNIYLQLKFYFNN